MTFLELCQFVGRYIQAGDEKPGTYPTTVVAQTDLNFEIVKGVQDAYRDILTEQRSWNMMQKQGVLPLLTGQRVLTLAQCVTAIADFNELRPFFSHNGERFVNIYRTSVGVGDSSYCLYVAYEAWRGYLDQGVQQPGKPAYFTQRPDRALEFACVAADNYSISLDYRIVTPTLTANGDVPIFNADWHEAIAWRAAKYWAMSRKAQADYQLFDTEYKRVMQRAKNDELPEDFIVTDSFFG